MRIALIAAAVLGATGLAGVAHAGPAAVSVQVAPELRAKGQKLYGPREADQLAVELRNDVQRELARTSAYPDASVELILADAVPNRPTAKQLGERPGPDLRSLGVGGDRIEGRIVGPHGRVTPVHFHYYSASAGEVTAPSTWGDADWTFQRFADELAHDHPDGA